MYYPGSENKDADQLRGYREADLRLCFRPCKLLVFSRTGSLKLYRLFQNRYTYMRLGKDHFLLNFFTWLIHCFVFTISKTILTSKNNLITQPKYKDTIFLSEK